MRKFIVRPRRIYAAAERTLTLAKGIILPVQTLNGTLFEDYLQSNPSFSEVPTDPNYYIAFTEAEYNPSTGQVNGHLMNHEELAVKLNVPAKLLRESTYFRVDLNANDTGTELTTSAPELASYSRLVYDYLIKLFNVNESTDRINSNNQGWMNIQSSEFKSAYNSAVHLANEAMHTIYYHSSKAAAKGYETRFKDGFLSRDEYIVPFNAICFAIINPVTNQGIAASDGQWFITSDSYENYQVQCDKIAKQLGFSSKRDLLFKTLFNPGYEMDYEIGSVDDFNTKVSRFEFLKHLYATLQEMDTDFEVRFNRDDKAAMEIFCHADGHGVDLRPSNQVLNITSSKDRIGNNVIYIPEDFDIDELIDVIEDTLYR